MKVATGLATGSKALPKLAAEAIGQAMDKAEIATASGVLLFLTSEFARDPAPALREAARQASCIQIMGCSAPGIFTEEDWVLDAPAAAAMVFGSKVSLEPPSATDPHQLLLTLAAPNAINTTWMSSPGIRFGGVSGDAMGQGPFSVWQNSKGAVMGHCESALNGVRGVVAAAHGLKMLNLPKPILEINAHELYTLGENPAFYSLQRAIGNEENLPLHLLMAVYANDENAIMNGDYQLAALVSANEINGAVTLAKTPQVGQYLCWALREPETAVADLQSTANDLKIELAAQPDFGLLFSCLGRGPYFYGGIDKDLAVFQKCFPKLPLIGFYGNGEIAPNKAYKNGGSDLHQYSAVVGLFTDTPLESGA